MYTEVFRFEFLSSIAQSERLRFLAEMADDLEKTVSATIKTTNPGFSIEMDGDGKVRVVIWHPWKRDAIFFQTPRRPWGGHYARHAV